MQQTSRFNYIFQKLCYHNHTYVREPHMSTTDDLPLSSLLEKANYIKSAMSEIEENITNGSFEVKKNGVQIKIKGTFHIERILLDPEVQQQPATAILPNVIDAMNTLVTQIEEKRKQSFKRISEDISSTETAHTA